jgi:ribonucleoside-diphosphate reductase alpha chain
MTKRPINFPVLTPNAIKVLEKRYLFRGDDGKFIETPLNLMERVAEAVASSEPKQRSGWGEKFLNIMVSRRFLPNSPTLMNAGRKNGQLSACFVLPVGDSLDSIFDTLKYAAKIHQSGGGTGFSFSQIRPHGSNVGSNRGVASGPVSFMKVFDVATETIKQGGTRRGANMAVLNIEHPDVVDFIHSKSQSNSLTNFNISVGVTDKFMNAVRRHEKFHLKDPRTGKTVSEVAAQDLFNRIVESAWLCGDPGIVFLDRMNRFNPTPREGDMESTNPCGEQPLLPFESCNLGSLNLGEYYSSEGFNWKLFRSDIWTAIRFLDNVIDVNTYPIPECERITRKNRKIGLGVMGFADLLMMEEVRYGSHQAVLRGEQIMSVLDREAKLASRALAVERGAFPNWKGSMWQKLGYSPLRNATVSTVAPTGTISLIAGASSGIEPLFSGVYTRNVLDGEQLVEIHPTVQKLLTSRGVPVDSIREEDIAGFLGPAWCPSQSVSVEFHVRMQAAFQRHSDSAVSKTINLPHSASREDISQAYLLADELSCKGITVYRDQSRPAQVLEHGVKTVVSEGEGEWCPSC